MHALILGWGLIAMKSTREFKKPEVQSVALEIITEGELAQMRKGDEKSKEKDPEAAKDSQSQAQKEPPKPKPKPVVAPPPPPPEPPKEPEVKPEEVLKEMAKTEPKPPPLPPEKAPEKAPEPPPPPKEEPKPDDILKEMAKAAPKPAPPPPPPKPPDPPPKAAEKPKPAPPPKPKPQPKLAEAKPVPTPPVKPGNKPSTFDAQQIAALIDKSPNAAPAPASTASPAPTQKASKTAAGIRDGQGPTLSRNEQQALTAQLVGQIKRCWRPPTGIPDAKNVIPVVSFKLGRDGSVSGSPVVLNRQGTSSFQLASEAATRAILQCQPYDMPADKYDGGWSAVELDFDPSSMF